MAETCGECGGSFASAVVLLDHLRQKHPLTGAESAPEKPERPSVMFCPICGARFTDGLRLAVHVQRPHPRPRRGVPTARPT
jgi:hypothetical protein